MKSYIVLSALIAASMQIHAQELITQTSGINEWLKTTPAQVGRFDLHPQAPSLRDGLQEWASRFGLQLAWQIPQNVSGHEFKRAFRSARVGDAQTPGEALERINVAFSKMSSVSDATVCVMAPQKVLLVIEDTKVPEGCQTH